MAKRTGVLELAVLGLLHEGPMHGYELRKRLNAVLGSFRAFSYGSLYPCLKDLLGRDWISTQEPDGAPAPATGAALAGKRGRIVYTLTAEGKEAFGELIADAGPSAWEDDSFGVHFAFFSRTDAAVRLRILEGRRSRLEERLGGLRAGLQRTRERLDDYTMELQRHGLEGVEREVRWLGELIDTERSSPSGTERSSPSGRERSSPSSTERNERRRPPGTHDSTTPEAPEQQTEEKTAWPFE